MKTIERESLPVSVVAVSQNSKIGLVASTMASQATCPKTCPLYNKGCYAESGRMALHTRRFNAASEQDPVRIAELEAEGIDRLPGKLPLRLHVVGDSATAETAKIVSSAADRYRAKRGQPVWSYTHSHDVPRDAWGGVSILRSCETVEQVEKAFEDGYAAAMVVDHFDKDTTYEVVPGLFGIPCPEMTGRANSCDECGLCLRADKLLASRKVILFAAHGTRAKTVKTTLRVLNG